MIESPALRHRSGQVLAEMPPLVVRTRPAFDLSDEAFYQFCRINPDLRIERTATGEIVMMAPAGGDTGSRNAQLTTELGLWARQHGGGVAFDSSTGFILPNGAIRSPDASWVQRERLAGLTRQEKQRFLPLCPDFVGELRSPTDRLPDLQDKMAEYIANGARLGWLLDPSERQVFVYRPQRPVEILVEPLLISGEPELSGLALDLALIWDPGF